MIAPIISTKGAPTIFVTTPAELDLSSENVLQDISAIPEDEHSNIYVASETSPSDTSVAWAADETLDVSMSVRLGPYAGDGILRASFEAHEVPLGLVLDWTQPLPLVTGLLPGSFAEARKEIMPGMLVQSINGINVVPGCDPWEIQQLFQQRPLSLVFDCLGLMEDEQESTHSATQSRPPNHIYQVGECYRAIARLAMRAGERLDSTVLAECLEGAVLQIVQVGRGQTGRRLKVFAASHVGWVSCKSELGQVLIATKPALLIPPPAEPTDNYMSHCDSNIELPRELALEPEMSIDDRHKRRSLMLDQRVKAGKVEEEKHEAKVKQHNSFSMAALAQKLRGSQAVMSWGVDFVPKRGSVVHHLDDSDDDINDAELLAAMGTGKTGSKLGLSASQRKSMASIALGFDEFEDWKHETKTQRFHRLCGVRWFKLRVQMKKIQRDQEGTDFPAATMMISDMRFELVIGFVIFTNGACIAIETFYSVDNKPAFLDLAEHFFTFVFLIEWIIRVMDGSWLYFLTLMNVFDTFLVWVTGVTVMWIIGPAGIDASVMRRIGALRVLRLSRLCKAIRMLPMFKELWMLVQGVMDCVSLLSWSLIVGFLVHYMFAVATIELIAKTPPFESDSDVQWLFGTVFRAMFTLFQIMTFDSWAAIVQPIVKKDPKSLLLFLIFIGIAGIVLFNLLTAIVVRNALESAKSDEEAISQYKMQEAAKIRAELLSMFKDLDEDESGFLSQEEFLDCMDDFAFVRKMKQLDIDLEDLPDIFEILDDGDGQVEQEEFVMGMMHLQGKAMSSEVLKATCLMQSQNVHFTGLEYSFVERAMQTFRVVDKDIEELHETMNDLMIMSTEIVLKLDIVGVRKVHQGTMSGIGAKFIEEPTLRDLQESTKRKLKEERKSIKRKTAKAAEGEPGLPSPEVAELPLPPGSYVDNIVPPEWIVREGRTPAIKNPGKTKLARQPSLKAKLMGEVVKKKGAKIKNVIGVHRDMAPAWNSLDLSLNPFGTLDTGDPAEDRSPRPAHLDQMPFNMVGDAVLRPPPSQAAATSSAAAPVLPAAAVGHQTGEATTSAQGQTGEAEPPHPHAMPEANADAMALLGLTKSRGGGVSRVDEPAG